MLFLKHPAWLWIKKNAPEKIPPVDPALQAIFNTGHQFEPYAESLFTDGVKVEWNKDDWESYRTLPKRTMQALDDGTPTVFQGRFEWQNFTFLPDIISVVKGKALDLYEIKSSTSANLSHILDLAFQAVVLENLGYTIRNIAVVHVNNQYVRQGDINPKELTVFTDVTLEVRARIDFTKTQMIKALETAQSSTMPDLDPMFLNTKLATSSDWQAILNSFPEYQKPAPDHSNAHPTIIKERLKSFLDALQYPLYFLDYETFMGLVPYFDGQRPYQQIPFQYSLHVLDSPDAQLRHIEYLHSENSDPTKFLCEQLIHDCGTEGTIISWNKSFEMGRNTDMGKMYPEFADALENINSRTIDLGEPFKPKNSWYSDPRFEGSWSIKKVLPVVVPSLSYKDLNIGNGGDAQRIWMETILDGRNTKNKDQILKDLRAYCGLDTLAMVEIFNVLRTL